jgi:ABC-type transport system involved in multi-copper enzyme maturation permease subunit
MTSQVDSSQVDFGGVRRGLRDVGVVARYELAEAVRSKFLVVVVLLFVGAGSLGAWSFTQLVAGIEENAAKVTGAPTSTARRPGGAMRRMRESGSYRDMVRMMVRDDQKADYYAAFPPIVVFFAWLTFNATPFLVLLTSAETIASEVANRSIRYSVLRTGRLQFALGKALGQALIIVGVTALAALVFYVIAWASLSGFEHQATALGMLSYWPRVLLYTLPFLGWAMLSSMVTRSANLARVLALGGGLGLAILSGLVNHPPRWLQGGEVVSSIRDLFGYLTPFGHYDGLSYPPGGAFPSDVAICLALAVLYFSAGFVLLRRRDL